MHMKFHHGILAACVTAALGMLSITTARGAIVTVAETPAQAPTCYRANTPWPQPGGASGCLEAANVDILTRATGVYPYSYGWATLASRTQWTLSVVQPKDCVPNAWTTAPWVRGVPAVTDARGYLEEKRTRAIKTAEVGGGSCTVQLTQTRYVKPPPAPPVVVVPPPAERWVFVLAEGQGFTPDRPTDMRMGAALEAWTYRTFAAGEHIHCSPDAWGVNPRPPGRPVVSGLECDAKVTTPMTDWELISWQNQTFEMQYEGKWRAGTIGGLVWDEHDAKKGDLIKCPAPHCQGLAATVAAPTVTLFRDMKFMVGMTVIADSFEDIGAPIFHEERVRPATPADMHGSDGVAGSFRNGCPHTKFGYFDPVAAFGKPGTTHLHEFCGAGGVDAFFAPTPECPGGSSTPGGIINCSEYHWPAVINKKTGLPVPSTAGNNYYKTDFKLEQRKLLRWPDYATAVIFGNLPMTAEPFPDNWQPGGWNFVMQCTDVADPVLQAKLVGNWHFIPPDCPEGAHLHIGLNAPNCWNGQKDSFDHRSHFSYSWQNTAGDGCDAAHPIPVVQFRVNLEFIIPKGATGKDLRCSSDALTAEYGCVSFHVDWLNGWQPRVTDRIIDGLKFPVDMGQGGLFDIATNTVTDVLH